MEEDRKTADLYAQHFLLKSVHIILSARLTQYRTRHQPEFNRWFNFSIGEVEEVNETLQDWRATIHVPITLKILCSSPEQDSENRVVEVWRLEYDEEPFRPVQNSTSYRDDACAIYKQMIAMTRALYTYVRQLPGHALRKKATSGNTAKLLLDCTVETKAVDETSVQEIGQMTEVMQLRTCGGCVRISVKSNDIHDLLETNNSVESEGMIETADGDQDDWVYFVKRPSSAEMQKPLSEHFKTSLESVKSAVTSFVANRTFQKAFSFPRQLPTSTTADLNPGEDKTLLQFSSEKFSNTETEVYRFLDTLQLAEWKDDSQSDDYFSVSEGRALLSMYHDWCK